MIGSKGALFVAELPEAMGERAFWTALGRHTRRFSGRVATTRDFERIFLQASNHDIGTLFETWVHGSPP